MKIPSRKTDVRGAGQKRQARLTREPAQRGHSSELTHADACFIFQLTDRYIQRGQAFKAYVETRRNEIKRERHRLSKEKYQFCEAVNAVSIDGASIVDASEKYAVSAHALNIFLPRLRDFSTKDAYRYLAKLGIRDIMFADYKRRDTTSRLNDTFGAPRTLKPKEKVKTAVFNPNLGVTYTDASLSHSEGTHNSVAPTFQDGVKQMANISEQFYDVGVSTPTAKAAHAGLFGAGASVGQVAMPAPLISSWLGTQVTPASMAVNGQGLSSYPVPRAFDAPVLVVTPQKKYFVQAEFLHFFKTEVIYTHPAKRGISHAIVDVISGTDLATAAHRRQIHPTLLHDAMATLYTDSTSTVLNWLMNPPAAYGIWDLSAPRAMLLMPDGTPLYSATDAAASYVDAHTALFNSATLSGQGDSMATGQGALLGAQKTVLRSSNF